MTARKLFENGKNIIRDELALLSNSEVVAFRTAVLLVPFCISLILRLPLLIWPDVIYNDSVVYIDEAKGILEGRWAQTIVPPLYPVLMVLINFLTNNLEWAGAIISFIFAVFLFVPVFHLAKELYDARIGMLAALFTAVHPCFIKYSGAVLTESIYYFLVATAAFTALKAHTTGRLRWSVYFGIVTAMGYLTKPEAIGFLVVFAGWFFVVPPERDRRPVIKRITIVLAAILSFAVLSSPYMLLLRKELGRWELSKKVSVSVRSEDAGTANFKDERASISRRISFSSFVKHPISFLQVAGSGVLTSFYKFQTALHPLLFLLALWGFTRRNGSFYPWRQNFLMFSFILFFFALVFPYFKMSARYSSQMIPLALPWAACGLVGVSERFARFELTRKRAVLIGLLIIMVGLFLQGTIEGGRERRVLQREVGLWLKRHGVQGEKLMSPRPHEAFYAEMELIRYKDTDLQEVINTALSKPVRYIVIHKQMEEKHPFFQKKMDASGLMPLRSWKQGENKIWVFERIGLPKVSTKDNAH